MFQLLGTAIGAKDAGFKQCGRGNGGLERGVRGGKCFDGSNGQGTGDS